MFCIFKIIFVISYVCGWVCVSNIFIMLSLHSLPTRLSQNCVTYPCSILLVSLLFSFLFPQPVSRFVGLWFVFRASRLEHDLSRLSYSAGHPALSQRGHDVKGRQQQQRKRRQYTSDNDDDDDQDDDMLCGRARQGMIVF